MHGCDYSQIKTNTWSTLLWLDIPFEDVYFPLTPCIDCEPDEALEVRKEYWLKVIQDTKGRLETATGKKFFINRDRETQSHALNSKKDKSILWDGPTVAPSSDPQFQDGRLELPIQLIDYSSVVACKSPDYAQAFDGQGIPSAGLELDVLIETMDAIVLSQRGIGSVYSQGWRHLLCVCPNEDPHTSFYSGLKKELKLKVDKHFAADDFRILAYVTTDKFEGSLHKRHHLIGYLKLDNMFVELEESFKKRGNHYFTHSVEAISKDPGMIERTLAHNGHNLTPVTKAALAYYIFNVERRGGEEKAFRHLEDITNQGHFG